MHLASRADSGIQRAGFIHIPYLPEQAVAHAGAASMPLEMLKTAILKVLESVLKTDKDLRIAGGGDSLSGYIAFYLPAPKPN